MDFARDVVLAGVFEFRHDDRERIAVGLDAGESQLLRSPQAEQLVATRNRLEFEFFAVRELLLETLFAFIERGHCFALGLAWSTLRRYGSACRQANLRLRFLPSPGIDLG